MIPKGYKPCPGCIARGRLTYIPILDARCRACARDGATDRPNVAPVIPAAKKATDPFNGPNQTERAARALFPGDWTFEGRTFEICGGARYTPDWVDLTAATAIEAKGEFIHSRDSRRRFDEAKHLFPGWTWIWCRLRTKGRKGRRWEIEVYPSDNQTRRSE